MLVGVSMAIASSEVGFSSSIEVLISKVFIDWNINNHDEFISVNDVLKEYNAMTETIKKTKCINLDI